MTVLFFSSFVSEVVHLYYKNDDAVEEDEEIQAFVKDVQNFGMQGFESCGECIKVGVFMIQQQHSRHAGRFKKKKPALKVLLEKSSEL